jgi:biopolymer transport protein ExbD
MARNFRRPRPSSHPIAELNLTNLIDLGFTLLIIFMVATPLINQEQTIPVTLPPESKSAQQKVDKSTHFVAISVDAKGNFYLDERPTPVGLAELRSRLRLYAAETKPPVIRIRGDAHVPYEKIIQVMDELKQVNLLKFTFDTLPVSK